MKRFAIWLLKKVYGIDVDGLRDDNKRLRDENEGYVSRIDSLERDKESLSELVAHLEEEKTTLQGEKDELKNQINQLQDQIEQQNEEFRQKEEGYNNSISQLEESLDDARQENEDLKKSLDEEKKEIESLNGQIQASPTPETSGGNDEALDEIENLRRQYDSLHELYEQEKDENKRLIAKISNQDSTIENLKCENGEQKEKIDSQSKEIAELNKKIQSKVEVPNGSEELDVVDETPPITETNGSIVIIGNPTIDNDSEAPIDTTKRTIDTVIDIEKDEEINADKFFSQPESVIFKIRTELEKAIYLRRPMYVCKYCGQMVKISGRKTERGMPRFFSHLRDSDDCDYKTTTDRTRREINREKFARCNEGERHKFLKAKIAKYLELTNGVTDVRIESTVKGNHPILRWRRPDVIANYRGHEVVFELQLSTTFVSVIAERDLFYRLNKKHIIWISNFDEQEEYVDLTNMMVKDIYYNNRMNIFIFDLDAQRKSEELGELVLKCNWLTPDGNWKYPNGNTSDKLRGEFIKLSDLTFDDLYKPYYVDAEQAYYAAHPEFKIKVASVEEQNKEIIAELDKRWEDELRRKGTEQPKTEEKIQKIIEDNEIDGVVKSAPKHMIAQRSGQYGLITYDGFIRLPFIYDEIKAHRGWYEGKRNGTIEVFASDYELIETDIRRIEKLGDKHKKYVKENNGDWLWGIMDNNAKLITQPLFSKVGVWSDKFIAVKDGQYCILDQYGCVIISGYDYISELDNEGVATITKDGREGCIDSECQIIKSNTERISDSISKISKLGKCGLENSDGTILVPCDYDDLGTLNNGIIGLNGIHFSQLDVNINADCPVRVKYVSRNERKMLIFKVGNREAFMNLRQQQKAAKNGLKPTELTQMYFSHANEDKNLLYLSATPVKIVAATQQIEVKDSDIPIGSIIEGSVIHVDKNSFIIKSEDGQTAYLHRSTWGEYSMEQFNKGQMVKVEKIGFDDTHKKHIWKILSVSGHMSSNVGITF